MCPCGKRFIASQPARSERSAASSQRVSPNRYPARSRARAAMPLPAGIASSLKLLLRWISDS